MIRYLILLPILCLMACSENISGDDITPISFCSNDVVLLFAEQETKFCISEDYMEWSLIRGPISGNVDVVSGNEYVYRADRGYTGEVSIVFTNDDGVKFTKNIEVVNLSAAELLSDTGSERATSYNDSNKIVSYGKKVHVTWLDKVDGKSYVKIKTYDTELRRWGEEITVDEARDNHGGAAILVDRQGYLHIVYYPHSQDPFRYRKSTFSNDASSWSEPEYFGTNGTYPAMVMLDNGSLLVFARVSRWQDSWFLGMHKRDSDGEWSEAIPIVEGNHGKWLSNAHPDLYASIYFQSPAVGADGVTVHLGFAISEAPYGNLPERGYVVGYVKSPDGGSTWVGKHGEKYQLPMDPSEFEIVEGKSLPEPDVDYFVGNLAVDPKGNPWLIYGRLDKRPYEAWIAMRNEDGNWDKTNLLPFVKERYGNREIHMPGSLTFDTDGKMYVIVSSTDVSADGLYPYWAHSSNKVMSLVSPDYGKSFAVSMFEEGSTRQERSYMDWLPNLEVSTSSKLNKKPSVIFTSSLLHEHQDYVTVKDEVYFTTFSHAN